MVPKAYDVGLGILLGSFKIRCAPEAKDDKPRPFFLAPLHLGSVFDIVSTNFVVQYGYWVGFKAIRDAVLACLRDGFIDHEARDLIDEKNFLLSGEVSVEEVSAFLRKCRGDQYESGPHHFLKGVMVHIFKPEIKDGYGKLQAWYIKVYLVEPNVCFISVHPSKK